MSLCVINQGIQQRSKITCSECPIDLEEKSMEYPRVAIYRYSNFNIGTPFHILILLLFFDGNFKYVQINKSCQCVCSRTFFIVSTKLKNSRLRQEVCRHIDRLDGVKANIIFSLFFQTIK
uniref:Uncharacterized protein n=1 Tax=Cacopsylla melanoneura TaxID=428564 RepID=A0A8D8ZAG1_9HEMI